MVLQLHVWGPAFGLPSIDAECTASVAYFNRIVPQAHWVLVADYDTSISPQNEYPLLIDGSTYVTGFTNIVSHLRNHHSGAYDLDYHLTSEQQTDRTAFVSFLQSAATPLVDLSLYVSSENYSAATSSSYTAILPWYLNYTIPPTRRDLARSRTAHLGLSSLDVSLQRDVAGPGSMSLGSDFEAAKRDAGIPTADTGAQPNMLSMGRGKGLQGFLSSPIYAARFKLDTLTNELLEPLFELLGKKDYLLEGGRPSSLDCLAFGYLATMFYPTLPQAWLKEALQLRYPRLVRYISRLREELLGREDIQAADVWTISSSKTKNEASITDTRNSVGLRLPWHPRSARPLHTTLKRATDEMVSNLPLVAKLLPQDAVIQASNTNISTTIPSSLPSPILMKTLRIFTAAIVGTFTGIAIVHRRNPRDGDLIFWALRPGGGGLGEAGDLLRALAYQLPR
ncbi:hypothetical protein K491DRAFT_696397 [Lophiostoma macrostomum CBS 122681]|uniref:Mitochondrial outer membrane transport complex Sam37/metaxin N-terminal domain-containing protein n=1 Tax=Lophiostoma macrostomum CBS 122681 TaxID=1314788 RepID=A0A6A6SUP2_9PLEO|nr:hypothetical protein K491DRAFT_696397 [Lophiostoma macrostomum CBS 122681]